MSLPARFQRKKHPRALPAAPRRYEPTHVQLKPEHICFVNAQTIWAQMERDRRIVRRVATVSWLPYARPPDFIRYSIDTNGWNTTYYFPITQWRN